MYALYATSLGLTSTTRPVDWFVYVGDDEVYRDRENSEFRVCIQNRECA